MSKLNLKSTFTKTMMSAVVLAFGIAAINPTSSFACGGDKDDKKEEKK